MSGSDFWSRRKAGVAAEAQAEEAALAAEAQAREQAVLAERSDEDVLAELGLKDPDSLEQGDDFSAFLASAVPERIRRRALRRLWLSNPALANLDELVDYGEDFTDAATVVENLQTTYQVGKGMLEHIKKLAADEETPDAEPAEAEETLAAAPKPEGGSGAPDPAEITPAETQTTETISTEEMEDAAPPMRRRMRFEFT